MWSCKVHDLLAPCDASSEALVGVASGSAGCNGVGKLMSTCVSSGSSCFDVGEVWAPGELVLWSLDVVK